MGEMITAAQTDCTLKLEALLCKASKLAAELEAAGVAGNQSPDNKASYRLRALTHLRHALTFAIGVHDRVEPHRIDWHHRWAISRLSSLGYQVRVSPNGEITIVDRQQKGH